MGGQIMLARIAMVMAIALSVLLVGAPEDASACHKGDPHGSATSCDGGGGGPDTLGDLNCAANQIAKFNGLSGAWECALDEVGGGGPDTLGDLNCTTDQIAKFNGASGAWECAFDEIIGILLPVLLDGNLEPIGTVVGVTDGIIITTFVEVQNIIDETRLTKLNFVWNNPDNHSIIASAEVRFDKLGCTGKGFIVGSTNNITDSVFSSAVIGIDGNAEWYVATSTEPESFVAESVLGGDGINCTSLSSFSYDGVPVEQVEVNIFDRFPLPYSLELR